MICPNAMENGRAFIIASTAGEAKVCSIASSKHCGFDSTSKARSTGIYGWLMVPMCVLLALPPGGAKRGQGLDREPDDHVLGRSRGGWGSKLHVVTDGKGLVLAVTVTAGQCGTNPRNSTM